ncbi:MAG: molybdenum cofactor guanylyltransferase [Leptolyngbyaceae cyanobacterium SM2_5_2]|nr:molybdenum cofactor guanylyltransferase [Leptolyngbyaceae cyanobacterium SM2_5_2]
MANVTTLVLAGGQSSRMGQDKALLNLGAETLLQQTCNLALACTAAVYVVTPWPDRYRPLLPDTVSTIQEKSMVGRNLGQGPLVALSQAVIVLLEQGVLIAEDSSSSIPNSQPCQWILALACDLPNLTTAALQAWINDLDSLDPAALAYLPKRQGRWEPLCGFYRPRCLHSWQAYIAAGGRSFQGWLADQQVVPIPSVTDAWLTNLNTPADLEQWWQHSSR